MIIQSELHFAGVSVFKLRLQETSRDTSQVGRWPPPSYLPRVNVCLPEIRSQVGSKF
jgi:hypothetical protein